MTALHKEEKSTNKITNKIKTNQWSLIKWMKLIKNQKDNLKEIKALYQLKKEIYKSL